MKQHFIDSKQFRHVSAWAIVSRTEGWLLGKILITYPIGGGMGAAKCAILVWHTLREKLGITGEADFTQIGTASGCGYDKGGAALWDALQLAFGGSFAEKFPQVRNAGKDTIINNLAKAWGVNIHQIL